MAECGRCDFHIHTKYLGCANATMEVPAIAARCRELGAATIGITDHLNSLDRLPLHRPIREDIEALDGPHPDVYFGVELNYTGLDAGFAYDAGVRDEYGFQFAIGGIHCTYLREYDLRKIVDIQHRHHLKTCADPLVDVLVHPYWFGRGEFERNGWPWFDTMAGVPDSYARELGRAARESGTAIEINASANLVNPAYPESYVKEYARWLAIVAEEGPLFSVGSDAHDIGKLENIRAAWSAAAGLDLPAERLWRPEGAPLVKGR